jgi:hypothetical protein
MQTRFRPTQTVFSDAAVKNYASTAKPSPTPTLFGVSLDAGFSDYGAAAKKARRSRREG